MTEKATNYYTSLTTRNKAKRRGPTELYRRPEVPDVSLDASLQLVGIPAMNMGVAFTNASVYCFPQVSPTVMDIHLCPALYALKQKHNKKS